MGQNIAFSMPKSTIALKNTASLRCWNLNKFKQNSYWKIAIRKRHIDSNWKHLHELWLVQLNRILSLSSMSTKVQLCSRSKLYPEAEAKGLYYTIIRVSLSTLIGKSWSLVLLPKLCFRYQFSFTCLFFHSPMYWQYTMHIWGNQQKM